MSSFYLDVAKDTLYAELPDAAARRSVQTVLYHIADTLLRLLTPVLAFTTEEVYSYLVKPADAPPSVQLLEMPRFEPAHTDTELEEKWQRLLELRELISRELEAARQAKVIGHSLDAALALYPDEQVFKLLDSVKEQLARILIVSQVTLHGPQEERPSGAQGEPELTVAVSAARGLKCGRCWIYSEQADENGLCPRCAAVVSAQG
jgi:isoleucyl-tRNA synthetase